MIDQRGSEGKRWRSIPLAVLLLLPAAQARGQAPLVTQTLDSATMVRLHLVKDGFGQGRLLRPFGPSSMSLRYCPSGPRQCVPVDVPTERVDWLQIQAGTREVRGFVLGTLIVGVVLIPLVSTVGVLDEGETRGSLLVKGITLSVFIGGGLGWLVGHGTPTWSQAP